MGYRCRKCGLACSSKLSRNYHENDCDDTRWKQAKDILILYDHNYTNNIVIPNNQSSRYSTWNHIHDIEHSYCGESTSHLEHNYCADDNS